MAATRFEQPRSVEFDVHRWYTVVIIVDRFGVTQKFRIGDYDGSGVYLTAVDEFGEDSEVTP